MAGPTPSWGTVPVFGTWLLLDGTPVAGKVRFTLPQRITNAPGDVIFPRNGVLEFALGAETGSINFDCPILDDPDNFPDDASVQILVEEIFVNAVNASYYIRPVAAMSGNTPPGLDLRTVVVVSDNPAAPPPSLIRGVPGGVAALDTSGNVIDGAGHPVVGGVASVNGHAGTVVLAASDVGADAAGAAAAAQSAAATYTNGQVANEASARATAITAATNALVNSAPGALDTLKELADALGDDANFATTVTNSLATKVSIADSMLNIRNYGARGDKRDVADAAITNGTALLTSATAGFTTADTGKLVSVAGAGAAGVALVTTISSVSGGIATLGIAAGATVSGAAASIGTDNVTAFAAAAAAASSLGVAGIFIPRGSYMQSSAIAPPDNVSWYGEGKTKSVIYPTGTIHGFFRLGTAGTPIHDIEFTNLGIDGSLQTGLQKGWYLDHLTRGRWRECLVQNTGASGFGCDFLVNTEFIACEARGCGRLGTISTAGCSGFGIGTGVFAVEDVYLIGCIAYGNKRFGAFFENQATATQSKGVQIIGGRYEANQWGISDNGTDGMIVNGAHIVNNIADGFKVNTTAAIHQVGVNGTITNCVISGNGTGGTGDGVQLDFTQTGSATSGRYKIHNNRIEGNANYGARVRINSTDAVSELVITDNHVTRNGYSGIALAGASVSASSLTNSEIGRNKVWNNGTAANSGNTYGIHISTSTSKVNVQGNYCTDTAPSGKTQTHGIYVATGTTLTNGRISDNDVRDNSTAALANTGNATLTGCLIERNQGYNPIGISAVTVGGSPFTYTAGPQRETLYVIGGTLSLISLAGTTIYNAGANGTTINIDLEPGISVVFTYSVIPTAIKTYKH